MMRETLPALLALLALLLPASALAEQPSPATDTGKINLELNAKEQSGDACRISFVIKNSLSAAIEDLTLELVLFNNNHQISKILQIKSSALPRGKTRVKRYAIKGLTCDSLGRVLINDVVSCKGEGLSPQGCLSALKTSSRTTSKLEL